MTLLRFTEWNLSDRTRMIAGASVASALAIGVLVWTNNLLLVGLLMIVIGGGMRSSPHRMEILCRNLLPESRRTGDESL